jgi:DNA-directed RNA polymerase specialized sigma24 family protein
MDGQTGQISELLAGWRKGDRDALDRLVPLIRPELYRLARLHLGRAQESCTTQPSSLVQAFLRLLPHARTGWNDRAHFLAAASRVMRHVLVDYASERRRIEREAAPFAFGGAGPHDNQAETRLRCGIPRPSRPLLEISRGAPVRAPVRRARDFLLFASVDRACLSLQQRLPVQHDRDGRPSSGCLRC